tara:strand:- start:52884 stop:53915 length:1032 start_codon:yes stop_codon:yes gene_type:complete
MKTALITGITGQDGAYLAQLLLSKGYKVYGTFRRVSQPNFARLHYLGIAKKIEMVPFDLLDQSSIIEALILAKPDEIYNLAAQSYVGASFEQPIATGEITGIGVTRILDAVRLICPEAKFYQASTSEMFGDSKVEPQNEKTIFTPNSPYAAAKLYAHNLVLNYRKAYNLFACCGILFNHESPIRGIEFVTRKITYSLAKIKLGLSNKIYLGNINAKRDWGYAKDYVEAMWLMLQAESPEEYVIATGKNYSVKEFGEKSFSVLDLDFNDYVEVKEELERPVDVSNLIGDPSKAVKNLGWNPNRTSIDDLINMMVTSDYDLVKKQKENIYIDDIDSIQEFPHFKQ